MNCQQGRRGNDPPNGNDDFFFSNDIRTNGLITGSEISAATTSNWNAAYDLACNDKMEVSVQNSTDTWPNAYYSIGNMDRDATMTSITAMIDPEDSGESLTFDVYEANASGTATTSLDAPIVVTNTGGKDDGTFTNGNVDAGDLIYTHVTAITGDIGNFLLTVRFNYCE